MADPVPAAPAAPVKSGWKTTELWLSMLLLGGLGYVIEQLLPLLPTLAADPSMPPWAKVLVPLAIAGLGFAAKGVHAEYVKSRVALKLPNPDAPDLTSAVAAGATAVNATNDGVLAALNK